MTGGCTSAPSVGNSPEDHVAVVTEDIQAGIEKHIEDRSREGNGYFKLMYEGEELSLKLVKVHTEYLANLGPGRHFACVDLVDTKGDVYDVDFFLAGDPGNMTVTETTAHKINGQPFYLWEQKKDKTWERVPANNASQGLLGVVSGKDEFEFRYLATVPELNAPARMWLPYPTSDRFQTVKAISVKTPGKSRTLTDSKYGNKILFLELDESDGGKAIDMRFQVNRLEKAAYVEEDGDPSKHLDPERLVPATALFSSIAKDVVKGKSGDLVRARAIYDHVIDRMSYKKYGEGWGKGDAVFACDARRGNCTDFHAYFMALARASNIPARFAIGAGIPSSRDDGGVSGYHCWVEFYAEGKWWPIDISEADKYETLRTYYFGHHPANRFEFSRGRDLVVDPGPESGPINFLAYPVMETEGELKKVKVKFTFKRTAGAS
ncbi:MAG: transglutaminase-like domain-containing protein [bacterium]|nr:transglutaminase-like domain-containing protein [bacterium]